MKTITRRKLYDITMNALTQSDLIDADRMKVLAAVDNPENAVVGVGGCSMHLCPLGLAGFWNERDGFTMSDDEAGSFYGVYDRLMDRALDGAGDAVRVVG